MQLGAINSVNFQGTKASKTKRVKVDNSSGSYENGIEKAKEKAKQDVHLGSVVGSLAVMAISITKGRKLVALGTKAVATISEGIARSAVKAAYGAVNAVKGKKGQAISPDKALKDITKFADGLRNENPKACTGLVEGTRNFVANIFGKEKGDIAANFLTKNGMDNKVGLAQGIVAAAVGANVADEAADKIENSIDNKNISRAEKAERAERALDTIDAFFEALA